MHKIYVTKKNTKKLLVIKRNMQICNLQSHIPIYYIKPN